MIKLNRTTEYGLLALKHMSRKKPSGKLTSAREVADQYGLPFEILAKTLQRLKDRGLIQSEQGARGGYSLVRSLEDITLGEFIHHMEGPQAVVPCSGNPSSAAGSEIGASPICDFHGKCEIKSMMVDLNDRVVKFLGAIKLAELAGSNEFLTPRETLGLGVTAVGREPMAASAAGSTS